MWLDSNKKASGKAGAVHFNAYSAPFDRFSLDGPSVFRRSYDHQPGHRPGDTSCGDEPLRGLQHFKDPHREDSQGGTAVYCGDDLRPYAYNLHPPIDNNFSSRPAA